jgi:hypothetical protein
VRNPRHMPARSEVGDDTPLRLAVAAALAYPDGSMTASGLRREAARGRLVIIGETPDLEAGILRILGGAMRMRSDCCETLILG